MCIDLNGGHFGLPRNPVTSGDLDVKVNEGAFRIHEWKVDAGLLAQEVAHLSPKVEFGVT
jgi:hypothetical protein